MFVMAQGRASESSVLERVNWLSPTDSVKTQAGEDLAGNVLPADEINPALELIDGEVKDLSSHAWWSDQTSGWLGAILGSTFGIGGGLCGWLTGRGKARWFVVTYYFATITIGIASLIAGLIAIALKQPYGVWYLLILIGVIVTVTSCVGILASSSRYKADELRRMNARDSD